MSNRGCVLNALSDLPQTSNIILFRADANPSIGVGHIMRDLSIADVVASYHHEVLFIIADDTVQELVASRGYPSIVLGTLYHDLEREVERISSIIVKKRAGVLVVDSYFVTERYLNTLWDICRSTGCRLVYIDDVVAFPYPCDVLLNYNIYGLETDYKGLYQETGITPKFLLGTSFTPLRHEFQNLKPRIVCRQGKNILISTGGSDCEHITLELVEEISKKTEEYITFHIIVGAMSEDKDLINDRAKVCPNIILHENVKNMCALMQSCDVAISAAGSTLYELCVTQTPAITYILSDNQIPGAKGFEHHGIMQCVGDVRRLGAQRLANRLLESALELCSNYSERCRIAIQMLEVVDGQGAERIAEAIVQDWRQENV